MMETVCQWLVIFNLALCGLIALKRDIEGRPAIAPKGFDGAMGTLVSVAIIAGIYYGAGAFDSLFGK
jgi:hypothetical protein